MSVKITFRPNLPPLIHQNGTCSRSEVEVKKQDKLALPGKQKPVEQAKVDAKKAQTIGESGRKEALLEELNEMIGLDNVKKFIYELMAFVEIQKRREQEQLSAEPLVLHMVFSGNPGSGKTTVARIVGRLLKELGLLSKGHLVECERADLVGEYIGHTANKTRDMVKKALGGILFIDEAYSLARGGEKDFGKEAIDALVKAMEDHKDKMILILAGYKKEMGIFVESNPGLRSRFPIHIDFPDYTAFQLVEIGESMFQQRQYQLSSEARNLLERIVEETKKEHPYAGNARLVRNIVEKTIRKQAVRLYRKNSVSREDLVLITAVDLCAE